MPAELGQTTDPKALVPGDPDTIFAQARTLDERRRDVETTGQSLRRIDTGGWTGAASERFHEQHNTDVPRWFHAADSFDIGAQTLTEHANVLFWAQAQAGDAIALWQQGENATAAAVAAHETAVADAAAATRANAARNDPTVVTAPGFVDTGAPLRAQAQAVLADARRQLTEAGDRAAEALLAEAETAPQDSLKQADANFYDGLKNSWHSSLGDIVDGYRNGDGARATGMLAGELLLSISVLGRVGKGATQLARSVGELADPPEALPPPAPAGPPPRSDYGPTRHRVKLRKQTKLAIIEKARRDEHGNFVGGQSRQEGSQLEIPYQSKGEGSTEPLLVDPDTGNPDPNGMTVPRANTFDFSHNRGDEWWRYKQEAEAGGYDRQQVRDDQNDPDRYHIEERSANRSRRYELPP